MIQMEIGNFEKQLVAGSTKTAMRDAKASSRDLWQVEIDSIRVMDNFNVRVHDAAYDAHIRGLANSMKEEGFYQDKPLAGYVAREGEEQVIYITDGHCRLSAAKLAVSEGAEILRLPVVVAAQGTSLEDLTVALLKSNSGKPLSPFEVSVVVKRLSRFGWDNAEIARRLDLTTTYVEGLLLLVSSPVEVREMVQDGQVSASTAIQALRAYGADAVAHLQSALGRAQASGKGRVTAKHLPGATFKKQVKKVAPKMFDALVSVKADPGYQHISAELREKLDDLVKQLEEAKAAADAGAQGSGQEEGDNK